MAAPAGRSFDDPQGHHPTVPHVIAFENHEQHMLILAATHARHRLLYWITRVEPMSDLSI